MGYLRFVRLPGVFTAFADIIAGFFILRVAGLSREHLGHLPQFLAASACFYLAGMAWNDLFDADEDAKLRPDRPVPSGEVSITGGYLLAIVLTTIGLMLTMAASYVSFFIAAALVILIFLYNSVLKFLEVVGPLCMGGCRGLNLLLGMSAHTGLIWSWQEPTVLVPPLLLTLYIAAATLAASWENDGGVSAKTAPSDPVIDKPTEIDSSTLQSAPPTDPREGQIQNTLRRRHELDIVLRQNRIEEPAADTPPYQPPAAGVRGALLAIAAVPLSLFFILPEWPCGVFALILLALIARPGLRAWRSAAVADLRPAVGAALSGICLFDAALLAGFCSRFTHDPEGAGACAVVAAMTIPVFILRRYIT